MEKHIPWNLTNDERGRQQYKAAQQRKHGTTVLRIAGFEVTNDMLYNELGDNDARCHGCGNPNPRPLAALSTIGTGAFLCGFCGKGKPRSPAAVDTETFNYGRALGVPTEETARKQYLFLQQHARIWADLATQFGRLAWQQEMALRDVRNCETVGEQKEAMAKAAAVWNVVDGVAKFEAKDGLETVKFFRYGRAFMSGQRVS